MKPKIVVAGILDTKGAEIRYLSERVREAGGEAIVMELSLGKATQYSWIDIDVETVIGEIGLTLEQLHAMNRGDAGTAMGKAAGALIRRLVAENQVDGVIGYAGGMGTQIITDMMQYMPICMPKFLLTSAIATSAPGRIGAKDINLMYPIFEAGINKVSRRIMNNAAGAIVGMAQSYLSYSENNEKPAIGLIMLGLTTPCALRASQTMEQHGYETMIVHSNGYGGKSMEALIASGYAQGFLDLTTNELVSQEWGLKSGGGEERMTTAAKMGVPQIIGPGGLDFVLMYETELDPKVRADIDAGRRKCYSAHRGLYVASNPLEDVEKYAKIIAEKLKDTTGPTAICVPMQGWSGADMAEGNIALGWAGPGATPGWLPSERHVGWSARSEAFIASLQNHLNWENQNIKVYGVDAHLNSTDYADFVTALLCNMLDVPEKWSDGEWPEIVFEIQKDSEIK